MFVGIGVGIGRNRFAQGIFNAYNARVVADGGITEAGNCVNAVTGLLLNASLLIIPSGYKGGKAYAEIPTNGNGDLTWTRASTALRTNSSGLLESMGSGVPRLSYMYGSCPALLLEPQRTNLCLYSEQFNDANWSKSAAGTGVAPIVTANLGIAPDGTTTADRIQLNRGGGNTVSDYSVLRQQVTVASTATTSISIYIKSYDNNTYSVVFSNSGVAVGQKITVTNQWQRVTLTGMSAGTIANIELQLREGVLGITGQSVTADLLLWGAQLELGAYPTTYIPTTTASATRVADSFSRNNIYTNGLITSSGGTWFVELRNNIAYLRDSNNGIFIGDTASINTGNQLTIRNASVSASVRLSIFKYISAVGTQIFTTTTDTVKIAIKWDGTSADVFVNGTKVVSATSFTTTIMENLLGSGAGIPVFIQAMAIYPSPLSDTDCTTLTTL